jgi:hypothetical protein
MFGSANSAAEALRTQSKNWQPRITNVVKCPVYFLGAGKLLLGTGTTFAGCDAIMSVTQTRILGVYP